MLWSQHHFLSRLFGGGTKDLLLQSYARCIVYRNVSSKMVCENHLVASVVRMTESILEQRSWYRIVNKHLNHRSVRCAFCDCCFLTNTTEKHSAALRSSSQTMTGGLELCSFCFHATTSRMLPGTCFLLSLLKSCSGGMEPESNL